MPWFRGARGFNNFAVGYDPERTLIGKVTMAFGLDSQSALLNYSAPGMPVPKAIVRMRGQPGPDQLPIIVCCGNPEAGFFKPLDSIQKLEMHWYVFGSRPV